MAEGDPGDLAVGDTGDLVDPVSGVTSPVPIPGDLSLRGWSCSKSRSLKSSVFLATVMGYQILV